MEGKEGRLMSKLIAPCGNAWRSSGVTLWAQVPSCLLSDRLLISYCEFSEEVIAENLANPSARLSLNPAWRPIDPAVNS